MNEAIYIGTIFALGAWGGFATQRAMHWKRECEGMVEVMVDNLNDRARQNRRLMDMICAERNRADSNVVPFAGRLQ